ncbi:MAG: TolC family protein [Planctomycetota bacterium]
MILRPTTLTWMPVLLIMLTQDLQILAAGPISERRHGGVSRSKRRIELAQTPREGAPRAPADTLAPAPKVDANDIPPAPRLPTSFPPRPPIEPPAIPLGPEQRQPLPDSKDHPESPTESGRIPYVQEETPGLQPPWKTTTSAAPPLELQVVIDAVNQFFPLLLAVEQERISRDGEVISALGAFDFRLRAGGTSNALGYYQYNQGNVGFEQQFATGGIKLFAGHRVGVGNFPSWYGNLETYQGGEFATGVRVPFLRNRTIDKYRATLAKAAIDRQIAEPNILKARIEFIRAASFAYWDWLAAGQTYLVSRSLLNLAETRDSALKRRIEAGLTKPIERTDNQRLIVQRRAKLVAAQQKFQQAAIKLSLYLRDSNGLPALVPAEQLPVSFPDAVPVEKRRIPNDVAYALERRPEIVKLNLQLQKNNIDMAVARNEFLPSMDAQVYSSQDVGGPNPKKDKGEYQLEAGLYFEVPLQRRYARGQMQVASASRTQLNLEQRYAQDKVITDLQNAIAAMDSAYLQVGQAREAVELARIMEEAERRNLFLGNSNILFVNLRESATVDAAILEVDALAEYYRAVADYRAALAADADDLRLNIPAAADDLRLDVPAAEQTK